MKQIFKIIFKILHNNMILGQFPPLAIETDRYSKIVF